MGIPITYRMMPPTGAKGTQNANPCTLPSGRTYSAAPGTTLDVFFEDAQFLGASGWVRTAQAGVGPTSGRPGPAPAGTLNGPLVGQLFADTTLGRAIDVARPDFRCRSLRRKHRCPF